MKTLPKPDGSYHVGSVTHEITDASRASHVASHDLGRRIFVKFWYPASESAPHTGRRELLWEQLRGASDIPGFARLLLRPAMKVTTNSHHGAQYATNVGPARVLIYSHGLISFASENSMLMEHLASYGYVVLALQHLDQLAEFRALQHAQSKEQRQEQAALERRIKTTVREEGAALWRQYFAISSNTNRIVAARAVDVEHAVTVLGTLLEAIPGFDRVSPAELVGVVGLSLGGAVATEYAKRNAGVGCVVNFDGGIYGEQRDKPVSQRYLMLCSQESDGANALSLQTIDGIEITTKTISGTKHLNFHDIAAVYPMLRWLRVIGSASPIAVISERNRLTSDFVRRA